MFSQAPMPFLFLLLLGQGHKKIMGGKASEPTTIKATITAECRKKKKEKGTLGKSGNWTMLHRRQGLLVKG